MTLKLKIFCKKFLLDNLKSKLLKRFFKLFFIQLFFSIHYFKSSKIKKKLIFISYIKIDGLD
jgi:hypothetical protein